MMPAELKADEQRLKARVHGIEQFQQRRGVLCSEVPIRGNHDRWRGAQLQNFLSRLKQTKKAVIKIADPNYNETVYQLYFAFFF